MLERTEAAPTAAPASLSRDLPYLFLFPPPLPSYRDKAGKPEPRAKAFWGRPKRVTVVTFTNSGGPFLKTISSLTTYFTAHTAQPKIERLAEGPKGVHSSEKPTPLRPPPSASVSQVTNAFQKQDTSGERSPTLSTLLANEHTGGGIFFTSDCNRCRIPDPPISFFSPKQHSLENKSVGKHDLRARPQQRARARERCPLNMVAGPLKTTHGGKHAETQAEDPP